MGLFKQPITVTGAPSSHRYNKKVCMCLIILFVGILSPVGADLHDSVINAVKQSLDKTQSASSQISALANGNGGSSAESEALTDCVDSFGDAVDQITHSLSALQNLNPTNFKAQLDDVQNSLNAALSDFGICSNGFINVPGTVKGQVAQTVNSVNGVVSNAINLVKEYASEGPSELHA